LCPKFHEFSEKIKYYFKKLKIHGHNGHKSEFVNYTEALDVSIDFLALDTKCTHIFITYVNLENNPSYDYITGFYT
jgi:hypothetical protein